MLVKNMTLPSCMIPDGADPCEEYQVLYMRAINLEKALMRIRDIYTPNGDLVKDIDKALYDTTL